tara:strand:- start:25333 stop:27333 length:2001 start_codon:yes stop_codon:yes gene_type:complete
MSKQSPEMKKELERLKILSKIESVGVKPKDDVETPYWTNFNKGNFAVPAQNVVALSVDAGKLTNKSYTSKADKTRQDWNKLPRTSFDAGCEGTDDDCSEFAGYKVPDPENQSVSLVPWNIHFPDWMTHYLHYPVPQKTETNKKNELVFKPDSGKQITDLYDPKYYEQGPRPYYDPADILVRCVAARCVEQTTWSLFERYACGFPYDEFNKKEKVEKPAADADEATKKTWETQRKKVRSCMKRFVLVYPEAVKTGFYADGNVCGIDQDPSKEEKMTFKYPVFNGQKGVKKVDDYKGFEEGDVDHPKCAPALMMRIKLNASSREGAPNNNISGFHDVQRLYNVSEKSISSIVQLLELFELGDEFPAVMRLAKTRGEKAAAEGGTRLNFEDYRIMHRKIIGEPPTEDVNDPAWVEWEDRIRDHFASDVWVRARDVDSREGIRFDCETKEPWLPEFETTEDGEIEKRFAPGDGRGKWQFKLVPLQQKRVEEINGSNLPSLADIKVHDPKLFDEITNTLRRLTGFNPRTTKNSTAIVEANEEAANERAELQAALQTANRELARSVASETQMRKELDEQKERNMQLKKRAREMTVDGGECSVGFKPGENGLLYINAASGNLFARLGDDAECDFKRVRRDDKGVASIEIMYQSAAVKTSHRNSFSNAMDQSED